MVWEHVAILTFLAALAQKRFAQLPTPDFHGIKKKNLPLHV